MDLDTAVKAMFNIEQNLMLKLAEQKDETNELVTAIGQLMVETNKLVKATEQNFMSKLDELKVENSKLMKEIKSWKDEKAYKKCDCDCLGCKDCSKKTNHCK
ncbi:predicted protein [Naegleria gruberi]|uniref:Predicted protein n=1 Tax=Naegleria gruberi TaxID=5762 RepID=D2V4S1_NAEGR|nr:uncharacterized protein NAEGRDRAFT_63888 [Naegleria gruberi]EFC47982.1 predicted protein [Naegleria gruberi]|eukprot:XP_002680726.1 predicted protein [Naegleria gruberi strain NEG-M]